MPTGAELLRTKSDTDTPDTDYVATQAMPAAGICYTMPSSSKHNGVVFSVIMRNSGGDRIANNSTTFTATPVLVDRAGGSISGATAYSGTVVAPIEVRVPEGYEVTLQLSALTSPPATIDTLDVMVTPANVT